MFHTLLELCEVMIECKVILEAAGLTLAVLTVLVAGCHGGVHAVTGGAVRGGAVGLRRGEAVHRLNGGVGRTLTAAG